MEGSSQNDEVVDSEETANGYTENLKDKNSEDPDKRNFEACEDENANEEAGRGERRDWSSEDPKKGNSGVPRNIDSDVPDEKGVGKGNENLMKEKPKHPTEANLEYI